MEPGSSNRIDEIEKKLDELNAQRTSLLKELETLKKSSNLQTPLIGRELNFPTPNTPEEKVQLFQRLFSCREDVFPRFWENENTGKKGYSPVCTNEWVKLICNKPKVKCSDCQH